MGAKGVKPKKYKIFTSTGFKGVTVESRTGRFNAKLSLYTKGGKRNGGKHICVHLGVFDTAEEANRFRLEYINDLI